MPIFKGIDLLRTERGSKEPHRSVVTAKQVGNEVKAIGEISPIIGSRSTRAIRCGIDLRQKSE